MAPGLSKFSDKILRNKISAVWVFYHASKIKDLIINPTKFLRVNTLTGRETKRSDGSQPYSLKYQ